MSVWFVETSNVSTCYYAIALWDLYVYFTYPHKPRKIESNGTLFA